tara:strand:- start:91 stop:522 length:432 start_codon:yes stop_codon:yes gene_type:complete
MKKLLSVLLLILSFTSSGQEQILNGISFNGPNGFTKAGDLHWNNHNENVMVQSVKGALTDLKAAELSCKKASRGSTFVDFVNIEISGTAYGFCLQKGQNTLALASTQVYRDGYTYLIIVSAEPDQYKRCFEIMGYMIGRVTTP